MLGLVILSGTTKVECAAKTFTDWIVTASNSSLGKDFMAGVGSGISSRMIGRSLYSNVSGMPQNGALLCVAGALGLGVGARASGGGSNIPFTALVGIATAAATLNYWPITGKSKTAEKIGDEDAARDLKRTITKRAGDRAANRIAGDVAGKVGQGVSDQLAAKLERSIAE